MISNNTNFLIGVSVLALSSVPGIASAQDTTAPASIAGSDAPADEIVVQGYRQSLETANAIKREADQIVDSLVAEDIGKLPDSTGAESLARITGVQVDRVNGEAAGLRLRGLPDLTTTYNGREVFTAEGRNVAMQDFPSASIARFDVYKTGSANLIEAGIAGEIDVRSRKPFDFKGLRVAGGVTGLHWRQSQRLGLDANLLVSNRWDTGIGEIGILVEGSYTDNNFVDSHRSNNTQILIRPFNPPATATFPRHRYPSRVSFQYPTSTRFRPSASAALQWRPSPELEIYADFLFQGFRGNGESRTLHMDTGSNAPISDVVLCPGSSDQICQMTMTGGNGIAGFQVGQLSGTDTYHGGGGFIWKSDSGARITGDVAYTDSTYSQKNFQMNIGTNRPGTRVFNFDDQEGGGGASAYVTDIDLTDPASWRMTNYAENGNRNHGSSVQARLDAEIPVKVGIFHRIQAGVRYSSRDNDVSNYTTGNKSVLAANAALAQFAALPLEFQAVPPAFKGDPTNHPVTWVTPTRESILSNADYLRGLSGQPAGFPALTPVYTANEKSYAAYLQTNYGFALGSIDVDGQIGIRAVHTTGDISGMLKIGNAAGTPYTKTNEYTDFLPNLSARFKLARNLQARVAFTKTRSRPSFGSLNPTLTINANTTCGDVSDPSTCYRNASGGNADLRPVESTNYDVSLEYYFSRSGSATIQAFRRDVTGFINSATEFIDDPEFGRLNITRPENGQRGRIQGLEAGFRTFLRISSLPDWAQNFGVLANYTYLDHGSQLGGTAAATLPGMQPLSNTSTHLGNAQIFYESKAVSLRASYNYRSHAFSYGAVTDNALLPPFVPAVPGVAVVQPTLPTREEGRGTLDFSGSLNPTPNLTLTFNVANALGTALRTSRQFNVQGQSYPVDVRYLETIYRLGARFRF